MFFEVEDTTVLAETLATHIGLLMVAVDDPFVADDDCVTAVTVQTAFSIVTVGVDRSIGVVR